MPKYKIIIDQKTCIGCGACASVCEEVFELRDKNGEMKAFAKKKETTAECAKEAADVCPVQAIKLS